MRGAGREVLRRMGLEPTALDCGTGEKGTDRVDARGRVAAKFDVDVDGSGDGPTAKMEVLRGDLARLVYEPACEHAAFRFGEHLTGLTEEDGAVTVRLAGGGTERYDAVIVAKGVGSATRALVFPRENEPRWMDMTIAYFTIQRN